MREFFQGVAYCFGFGATRPPEKGDGVFSFEKTIKNPSGAKS